MEKCFVIMPFGKNFDSNYSDVIKPTITSLGMECLRGDEIYSSGVVISDIYDAITNSDFCIADVTDKNPNVNYELGMAHAIGKPTILITQKNEDVPFDYKHVRLIKYETNQAGWEKNLGNNITKTIKEIRINPNANRILIPKLIQITKDEKESIKKHIENIYYNQSYDLDRVNRIYFDKNDCTIKTSWKGTCHSDVYHLCHNIVCDLPGQIKILRAFDRINAREMDCLITYHEPQHFTYFFFFKQFKNTHQPFDVETEISAQGYLDLNQLMEKGETLMSTQAVANGIRYTNKEDWLYFPKIEPFSKVSGIYISHPNSSLIDKRICVEESETNFILKLKYYSGDAYQQETAARILIS